MCCEVRVQIHSFACGYSVAPKPFVEDFFPHWMVLLPLWKLIDCKCKGLFLDFQFYFFDLYFSSYANTTLLWLLQWCSTLDTEKYETSNLFFFFSFKIVLTLGSLYFYMNFRISLSISAKKSAGILMGIVLNLYITLGSIIFKYYI